MKKLLFIVLLGCSLTIFGQNDSIVNQNQYEYYDSFNEYWHSVTFKIGGGVLLPQGKLKTYFEVSPMVELSLDFPVTDNKSIELALQFILPEQRSPFLYESENDISSAEASLIVNPLVRFKKNLSSSESSKFILGLGIGASVISSNQKGINESADDNNYEITSFLLAPSLDYVKTFNNNEQLTFSLGLHYAPYKVKGTLEENIGAFALTPRVLYSF